MFDLKIYPPLNRLGGGNLGLPQSLDKLLDATFITV